MSYVKSAPWNPISSTNDSKHLMPVISPYIKGTAIECHLKNSAESLLWSSVLIYKYEYDRAYKIMKKLHKEKVEPSTLYAKFQRFVIEKDGKSIPDNDYNFVIELTTKTKAS